MRPASAAIGPELRVRPAAASSWPEDPQGRVPHGPPGSTVGTKASWGRAASLLTAPRDDRRGPILPSRAAAGPVRAFRPGGAIFEIAGARALDWRPRASRPAWRGRRLRERASAAPPRGRGCRRAGQRHRAGEHSFLRGEKASPRHSHACCSNREQSEVADVQSPQSCRARRRAESHGGFHMLVAEFRV